MKFTDPGGRVSIRVTTASGWVAVAVQDTGIGIEPDMLPHVFETFTQADRTLDRSRGGLGLGLALVKGLVELHGGEVKVHSAGLRQGAEFTFRLPLVPSPTTDGLPLPSRTRPAARGWRILIIEDHRDAAQTLRLLQDRLAALLRLLPASTVVVPPAHLVGDPYSRG